MAIVCTNPQRHLHDARLALEGGASVIVEKPLTYTLAQADELVALTATHGQRVGYAENMAFAPIVTEALARIATIGELRHIEARALNQRPTWGDFTTAEWGGGALYDLGAHPLALAMLIARAADQRAQPTSVRAHLRAGTDIPTDEHGEAWITFSNGVTAHVEASWLADTSTWDMQASSDSGVVHAAIMPHPELSLNGDVVPISWPTSPLELFGYVEQLRNLTACIAAGATPLMNAEFGREILDITCGAYASARSGEAVQLPFTGDRTKSPWELWRA